jgi:hypothetical protein
MMVEPSEVTDMDLYLMQHGQATTETEDPERPLTDAGRAAVHLRHTCASLAVSAGVNVLALQRMLGHTSAKVTLDTYADLFDDDLDAVAVTLHARYSPEITRKCGQNVGMRSEER